MSGVIQTHGPSAQDMRAPAFSGMVVIIASQSQPYTQSQSSLQICRASYLHQISSENLQIMESCHHQYGKTIRLQMYNFFNCIKKTLSSQLRVIQIWLD